MVAEAEADLCPLIIMSLHGDAAVRALLGANRPVLLERARALDRRLVHPRALEYLVCPLLRREVPHRRPRLIRRQIPMCLDHVVLDQGVAGLFCPTIVRQ